MKRKAAIFILLVLIILSLAGCSNGTVKVDGIINKYASQRNDERCSGNYCSL